MTFIMTIADWCRDAYQTLTEKQTQRQRAAIRDKQIKQYQSRKRNHQAHQEAYKAQLEDKKPLFTSDSEEIRWLDLSPIVKPIYNKRVRQGIFPADTFYRPKLYRAVKELIKQIIKKFWYVVPMALYTFGLPVFANFMNIDYNMHQPFVVLTFVVIIVNTFRVKRDYKQKMQNIITRIGAPTVRLNQTMVTTWSGNEPFMLNSSIATIDGHRKKYIQYALFPSKRERRLLRHAANTDAMRPIQKYNIEDIQDLLEYDASPLGIANAHYDAARIAQAKIDTGMKRTNEYEQFVKKYAKRMDPDLKFQVNNELMDIDPTLMIP